MIQTSDFRRICRLNAISSFKNKNNNNKKSTENSTKKRNHSLKNSYQERTKQTHFKLLLNTPFSHEASPIRGNNSLPPFFELFFDLTFFIPANVFSANLCSLEIKNL